MKTITLHNRKNYTSATYLVSAFDAVIRMDNVLYVRRRGVEGSDQFACDSNEDASNYEKEIIKAMEGE